MVVHMIHTNLVIYTNIFTPSRFSQTVKETTWSVEKEKKWFALFSPFFTSHGQNFFFEAFHMNEKP